jgi:hypothetical protein
MDDISPADWKVFKPLRAAALERFCQRTLDEIARVSSDQTKSKHQRYIAIYRLMQERDIDIVRIFDTLRRSTAVRQIYSFRSHDLLTEDEFRRFSPELVKRVEQIIEILNRPIGSEAEEDPGSDVR